MKTTILAEPELEFGDNGRHEDIRFGILNFGLLNQKSPKSQIRVGIVGTSESVEGTKAWFEKCLNPIGAKESNHKNLYPHFPGFSPETCFAIECLIPDRGLGVISERLLVEANAKGGDAAITELSDIFSNELKILDEKENLDVVICAIPQCLLNSDTKNKSDNKGSAPSEVFNFRGMLKAKAMKRKFCIQLLLPVTYGEKGKRSIVGASAGTYQQEATQDEATRAWNFFVGLVYKSGISPWRLVRNSKDYESCFVGISFYKSLDSSMMMTSIAQVFNERGEGMIIRGEPVQITKDDPQPHLTELDAGKLLRHALTKYREEHKHLPARVIVHKTSTFNQNEIVGFTTVAKDMSIEYFDLVSIAKSDIRLFRSGNYPPLRGTYMQMDKSHHLLYTRGSSQFYQTYTGMYIPRALEFRLALNDSSAELIASEILALTKLNWNSTQIDGSLPITIRAARRVGDILKYVPEDEEPKVLYSYYI